MTEDQVRRARWSGDEAGRGIGDAGSARAMVDDLRAGMADTAWLTEDVQLHLAEKLIQAATAIGVEVRTRTSARGVLLAEAIVPAHPRRELRAIAYRWLAEIAESQTVVRERHGRAGSTYLIATGQPDGPRFAAHGHVIELRLRHSARQRSSPGSSG